LIEPKAAHLLWKLGPNFEENLLKIAASSPWLSSFFSLCCFTFPWLLHSALSKLEAGSDSLMFLTPFAWEM